MAALAAAPWVLRDRAHAASPPDNVMRLRARIGAPRTLVPAGQHPLALDTRRDGVLYVPASVPLEERKPLIVLLHHAGSSGARWLRTFAPRADALPAVVVAPDARSDAWELSPSRVDRDVLHIDQAIAAASRRAAIDPARVTFAGFADGASFALTVALANGDIVQSVVAFSPGFYAETTPIGRPRIFMAHGTADPVAPIVFSSRVIAAELRKRDYSVEYAEFEGGHELPVDVVDRAMAWLAAP